MRLTSYVYNLCCQRKIPHFKKMGKLYFRKREVNQWLEEGHQNQIK